MRQLLCYCTPLLKIADGLSVEKILEQWPSIKPVIMKDWGEDNRDALIELFGKVRDDWIAHDLQGWICANRFVTVWTK